MNLTYGKMIKMIINKNDILNNCYNFMKKKLQFEYSKKSML